MSGKTSILTFDIEDWFHILDNPETATPVNWQSLPSRFESGLQRILDFLDARSLKATFFILGWVAERYTDAVADIARRGHEIACHSHLHQLVFTQTEAEFEGDLLRALTAIEKATGVVPKAYRAPGFSITESCTWAFDVLARNGIETDCSIFPAARAHGGMQSFPMRTPCRISTGSGNVLKCFPLNFLKFAGRKLVFSGGGYFRLLPHPVLATAFRHSDYVMTYFHPRDFDPDQPAVPGLGRVRHFKSYVGIKGALGKLDRIAQQVSFKTLRDADAAIDWGATKMVLL
ncbi:MAG: polysaccharide deacetylase [Betaproteobacteria bacterium HGW-Betaproteobacteria-10]|nr:MAG: polysaccharide deacetylase [Betaproteobacteria bacterium HGW-Betaproteobacteria-10]